MTATITIAALPPIVIAVMLDRRVADLSKGVVDVDADSVTSSPRAGTAETASARRRGNMTVTSDDSFALSGIGARTNVSLEGRCDATSTSCCAPQKEQNLAASTID